MCVRTHVCMYVCIYMYICIYVYIYIYRERQRELHTFHQHPAYRCVAQTLGALGERSKGCVSSPSANHRMLWDLLMLLLLLLLLLLLIMIIMIIMIIIMSTLAGPHWRVRPPVGPDHDPDPCLRSRVKFRGHRCQLCMRICVYGCVYVHM